jgi:hypothetical protein
MADRYVAVKDDLDHAPRWYVIDLEPGANRMPKVDAQIGSADAAKKFAQALNDHPSRHKVGTDGQ